MKLQALLLVGLLCAAAPRAVAAPSPAVQALCHQYTQQAQALAHNTMGPTRVKKALKANNLATEICNDPAITDASRQMVMRLLTQQLKDLRATHWVGAKPQL